MKTDVGDKKEKMSVSPSRAKLASILERASSACALMAGAFVCLLFCSAWFDSPVLFDTIASDVTIIGVMLLSGIGVLIGIASVVFSRRLSLLGAVGAGASLAFGLFLLWPIVKEVEYPSSPVVSGARQTIQLRTVLSNVDSVAVYPIDESDGGTSTPIIVTNSDDVHDLVFTIHAEDTDTGVVRMSHCGCGSLLELHFFSGTNAVTGFACHHGEILCRLCLPQYRDSDDLPTEIWMTKESQHAFSTWLTKQGIPQQNIRQVSPEAAPSASPSEPSM